MKYIKDGAILVPDKNLVLNRREFIKKAATIGFAFGLGVESQARRRFVPKITSAASGITADFWQNFEFTTLNATNLSANDHTSGGSSADWSVNNGGGQLSTSTSGQMTMLHTINGITDTGTRGLAYISSSTTNDYLQYNSLASHSSVSIGMWVKIPTMGSDGNNLLMGIYNIHDFGWRRVTGTYQICWGDLGGAITISPDTWYWVTVLLVNGGTCKLRVYDSTGVQVGTETTQTGNGADASQFFIMPNFNNNNYGATFYMDNIVINWATATYPLGP